VYDDDDRDPGRLGLPIDSGRIRLSIHRGWRIVPAVTLVAALLGVGAALTINHSYKSETVLIWEPIETGGRVDRELSTQAGILKLPSIIKETGKRVGIKMPAEQLANRIDVWFDRRSSLVTVEATSGTAKGAARLADTLVSVFLSHQEELARTRASELVDALQKDLDAARDSARAAQARYDAFRAKHDVVDPIAEAALALQAVSDLKSEQATALAEATALDAQASRLGDLVRKQPRTRVQSASSTNAAAQELARARAQLTAAQARLAPNHPKVLSLQAQIQALESTAASETAVVHNTVVAPDPEFDSMRTILSTTRARQAAASERGKSFEQTLREAEERLARLSAIEAQARDLSTEIERGNKRVAELETQLFRAREAARAPAVEFRVLTPAVIPQYPEKSRRRIVAIGLTLLGLIGSIMFLILRPLRDGKVYSAREAAYWSHLPVIASTAWPSRDQLYFSFVEELGDDALRAKGTTLILGLDASEARLAVELASGLSPVAMPVTLTADDAGNFAAKAPYDTVRDETPDPAAAGATPEPTPRQASSTALAVRTSVAPAFFAWRGPSSGPALRRAVRIADRVIVLVRSGGATIANLATLRNRLGRTHNVAVIVVAMPEDLLQLPDRVGDVEAFWHAEWFDSAAA
jgi:uncharacterized protein involved in exopolysaccharide biosynthesis